MYYRMYYPRLPASYCADNLTCPRLAERYNPYSRGYLASRAAYLKRTSAMPFTRTFGPAGASLVPTIAPLRTLGAR